MPTPRDVFGAIHAALAAHPGSGQAVSAVYQFDLSGDDGGVFHIVARDGAVSAGEGPVDNPNTTISMSAGDFVDLSSGRLDPTMAFMSGKLKIKGDYGAAMKLQALMGAARS